MVFLTKVLRQVTHLTRLNVVDNSKIGQRAKEAAKPVKIIHIYNGSKPYMVGTVGDKVLVTILGEMKKGIIVGCRQKQAPMVPKFDSNNVVLVDKDNVPLGTRVTIPLPNILRKKGAETARLMAIGTRFI